MAYSAYVETPDDLYGRHSHPNGPGSSRTERRVEIIARSGQWPRIVTRVWLSGCPPLTRISTQEVGTILSPDWCAS